MKLSSVDLLEALERPECAPLREVFAARRMVRGQGVFWPGQPEDLVLVVRAGRFRVYLSYGGKEFTLAILERGDIYSSHTGAHVQAMTDGEALMADTRAFHSRASALPELAAIMVRVLGQMLRTSFFLIEGLVFRQSNTRLAALLLEQAERAMRGNDAQPHGRARSASADPNADPNAGPDAGPDAGPVIRPGLTTEQLAALVGASRQTVSTLLNDMIRSGILDRAGRGAYRVRDMNRLRELADA